MSASRMLGFVTPPDVSSNFIIPLLDDVKGAERLFQPSSGKQYEARWVDVMSIEHMIYVVKQWACGVVETERYAHRQQTNPIWYSQGIAAQRRSSAAWAQGWTFLGRGALRAHVSCNDPLGSGARSYPFRGCKYGVAMRSLRPELRSAARYS